MAREIINIGTPNNGDGDTLYNAGDKINNNFEELYDFLGTIDMINQTVGFTDSGLEFNGVTFNTTLGFQESVTQNVAIELPPFDGTLVTETGDQDISNKVFDTIKFKNSFLDTNFIEINVPTAVTGSNKVVTLLPNDSDEFTLTGKTQTLTNKTLTQPAIDKIKSNTSPNTIDIAIDSDTGFSVSGTDTNIDLNLSAKNDGTININSMVKYSVQTITIDSSVVSLSETITEFDSEIDLSLISLPNGSNVGSKKILINTNNSGTITVEPSLRKDFDTLVIKPRGIVELIWMGTSNGWMINSPYLYSAGDNALWYITN